MREEWPSHAPRLCTERDSTSHLSILRLLYPRHSRRTVTHVPYSTQPPSRAPTPHPTSHLTNPTQPPNIVHPVVNSPSHHLVNTITVNTPHSITAVHNVNTEHIDHTAPNTLPPTHVTSVNTVNRTSTNTAAPYANDAHTPATPTPTPAHLHDLLTPHLLHQHSILSAVHALLIPLPPTAPTPLTTLHTLHRILSDSPKLLALLPHVPRIRPLRAPPPPMLTHPNPTPSPCHVLSRTHLAILKESPQHHQLSVPLTPTQGLVYLASAIRNHHMPN